MTIKRIYFIEQSRIGNRREVSVRSNAGYGKRKLVWGYRYRSRIQQRSNCPRVSPSYPRNLPPLRISFPDNDAGPSTIVLLNEQLQKSFHMVQILESIVKILIKEKSVYLHSRVGVNHPTQIPQLSTGIKLIQTGRLGNRQEFRLLDFAEVSVLITVLIQVPRRSTADKPER